LSLAVESNALPAALPIPSPASETPHIPESSLFIPLRNKIYFWLNGYVCPIVSAATDIVVGGFGCFLSDTPEFHVSLPVCNT
jgi:hypothetical protein